MIKYIGSKRLLVPLIVEVIGALEPTGRVIDLFSGTSRVGHALKRCGYQVFANDINTYAATLAHCYVEADHEEVIAGVTQAVGELNHLKGQHGYFTKTFCEDSRFLQPHNGERVDAMREWIATAELSHDVRAVLLVSLMEAADRVDSTTGVQMAYLKSWSKRSFNDIELRIPDVLPRAPGGKGRVFQMEAQVAAKMLSGDVAYLDPPYNQHKYLGNYHVWETLVRWDSPDSYGVANKRVDCRDRKSDYNSRPRIRGAIERLVDDLDVRHLVVSFSNEGYVSRDEIVEILNRRGDVMVLERDYRRYVGAQIGIHNPKGVRVGEVSHLSNKEFVFVVSDRHRRGTPSGRLGGSRSTIAIAGD